MNYRIAIGSSDGIVVNAHFGKTPLFHIYLLSETHATFVEVRTNLPGCSSLSSPLGSMEETIELIRDCDYVIVSQIGRPMVERLNGMNIKVKIIRNYITEALVLLKDMIDEDSISSS